MDRLAACAARDLPGPPPSAPDSWEQAEPSLATRHGSLWAVVREEARTKHRGLMDRARRFTELREQWGEIWAALALLRPDPASLRLALKAAGAPATPADLGFSPKISPPRPPRSQRAANTHQVRRTAGSEFSELRLRVLPDQLFESWRVHSPRLAAHPPHPSLSPLSGRGAGRGVGRYPEACCGVVHYSRFLCGLCALCG